MPRLVLDPGHGGRDQGARGKKLKEKEVNLRVCLLLRDALRRCGIEVLMTREKDTERVPDVTEAVDLKARAMLANTNRADLFVSWHYDVSTDPRVRGVAVWIHPSQKGMPVYHKADLLSHHIAVQTGQQNRGVYLGDFQVLRDTYMDAVVIEGGFLTNPEEEAALTQDEFLAQQAEGAAVALCRILDMPYIAPEAFTPVEVPKKPDNNVVVHVSGEERSVHGRLIDGKTYVPVREVAELLGYMVKWDGISQTVRVTRESDAS